MVGGGGGGAGRGGGAGPPPGPPPPPFLYSPVHIYFFLLGYENTDGFVTFCANHMPGENLVFELGSKNLQTNQNSGIFKAHYLRKDLRHEVELLYVIKHPQKQRIYSVMTSLLARHDSRACPKLGQIVHQVHLKNYLNYKVVFLHVVRDLQKLKIFFNFKQVWLGMFKVNQKNKLAISEKWTQVLSWIFECGQAYVNMSIGFSHLGLARQSSACQK